MIIKTSVMCLNLKILRNLKILITLIMKIQKLKSAWNTATDNQRVLNVMRNCDWRIFLSTLKSCSSHTHTHHSVPISPLNKPSTPDIKDSIENFNPDPSGMAGGVKEAKAIIKEMKEDDIMPLLKEARRAKKAGKQTKLVFVLHPMQFLDLDGRLPVAREASTVALTHISTVS